MRAKIPVMVLTAILAISPLIGSGEYTNYTHLDAQENPVYVNADGFTISINTESPEVDFYRVNESAPVFTVTYSRIYAYSTDISEPEFMADLSTASWTSSVYNTTEEDGTIRTVVKMSAPINMTFKSETVSEWGEINFDFLILVKGDEAQLGVSLKMSGLKPLSDVSHIALVQDIGGYGDITVEKGKISVSGVYYRWDPDAMIKNQYRESKVEVKSLYSDGNLYLIYPYDTDVQEISHYSGRVDIGTYGIIRDITGEVFGYGLGILLGSLFLGLPYATHRKKERSPFDMDSPLYRK